MGADSALKEFLGPRADNKDSKIEMYQRISEDGYLSLNDLSNNIESSQTINTVDTAGMRRIGLPALRCDEF